MYIVRWKSDSDYLQHISTCTVKWGIKKYAMIFTSIAEAQINLAQGRNANNPDWPGNAVEYEYIHPLNIK